MVKDRKSSIPRKREADKPSPAKAKQASRSAVTTLAATVAAGETRLQLTAGEINILAVFRKYLMTPGRMLCLNNTDIGTMKRSLEKLTAAGLLIPEDFKGSYSLTRSGFKAMNELC